MEGIVVENRSENIINSHTSKIVEESLNSVDDSRNKNIDLITTENDLTIESNKLVVEDNKLKFKTKKARDIFQRIQTKIKKHFTLKESVDLLEKFNPITNKKIILKRQSLVKKFLKDVGQISDIDEVQLLLQQAINLEKNVEKRHTNIVIAFGDEDSYDEFKSILGEKYFVTLVQTEHDLLSITHYEEIRYVKSEQDILLGMVEELDQAIIFSNKFTLEELAPELYTDFIELNNTSLEALNQLSNIINFKIKIPTIDIKKNSFTEIGTELETIKEELQKYIQERIVKEQFSGDNIISIIQNNHSLLAKLNEKSQQEITEKKTDLLKYLENKYGLSFNSIITIDNVGKVLIDEIELENLQKSFLSKQQQNKSIQKQQIAKDAKLLLNSYDEIIRRVKLLDLKISLSLFFKEYELELPKIDGEGIEFVYGRNMNLLNPVPIEYYVGKDEKVAIITGANSGGKTTLLELLMQIQLLAQMGLGVPAKNTRIGVIGELYYFSKSKGSVNAGAFETLLKQFANISEDNSKKLILADEIESVTEPDVAAKIIKGIVNHSKQNVNNLLVLVTHMGKELEKLGVEARFDGIEAKGLDKNYNLVVERNPVIGKIARSTPQLIIERLAKKETNNFYSYLHNLLLIKD